MFVLVRAITYASLFIALFLIYLPNRFLARSGIVGPTSIGFVQIGGIILGTIGAVIAIWCILTFVVVGKGTPAPFDPPKKLVVRGPYRFVRNPMYIGAGLALIGASLFYQSRAILIYAGAFLLATHIFVIGCEEPTLRKTFGTEYDAYSAKVRRWRPGSPAAASNS